LCSACGVYLEDDSVVVRNRFYVWLDDWLAYLVVARPWLLFLFGLEHGFAKTAALERGTAVQGVQIIARKVLARSHGIR
jgi:hypothetical protein